MRYHHEPPDPVPEPIPVDLVPADPVPADPVPADPVQRRLRQLIDDVEASSRAVATAMAVRAESVDRLRQYSEEQARRAPDTSRDHGWSSSVCAERELLLELVGALSIPETAARNLLSDSRFLVHELPATLEALRDGAISFAHAQVLIDNAVSVSKGARAAFEETMLPAARELTVPQFRRLATRSRERLEPSTTTERHVDAISRRAVWVEADADGMAVIGARLSAECAHAILDRLSSVALAQNDGGDDRTLAQRRADAFADLLLTGDTCAATAEGTGGSRADVAHGIHARVLVTVPVMTLLGRSDRPATLEGYGPIDPDTARALAAGAPSFSRILAHPVSSAILDYDRTTYAVPSDLRTVLRVRDETCRAIGCSRPAARSDIDHTIDWALDGTTSFDNLAHLCRNHHNVKSHTRVRLRQLGGGELEWTLPSGRVYVTHPATRMEVGTAA